MGLGKTSVLFLHGVVVPSFHLATIRALHFLSHIGFEIESMINLVTVSAIKLPQSALSFCYRSRGKRDKNLGLLALSLPLD